MRDKLVVSISTSFWFLNKENRFTDNYKDVMTQCAMSNQIDTMYHVSTLRLLPLLSQRQACFTPCNDTLLDSRFRENYKKINGNDRSAGVCLYIPNRILNLFKL